MFVNCFDVLCTTSLQAHLPEDGHNRWPKHVAGYAVYNEINLRICVCTCWVYSTLKVISSSCVVPASIYECERHGLVVTSRSNDLKELYVSRSGKFLLMKYTFYKTCMAIDICLKHLSLTMHGRK